MRSMPPTTPDSGEMSQDSEDGTVHLSRVDADALPNIPPPISGGPPPGLTPAPTNSGSPSVVLTPAPTNSGSPSVVLTPAIDPAARASKRMYEGLSASSVGLELGIAVIIALLVGMWLDRRFGTEPALMLIFLGLGLAAGFRNVLRAVARAEKSGHG